MSSSLAVTTGLWWWADLNAQKTYLYMDKWQPQKHVGSLNEWKTAYQQMQEARKFNPYSVDYMITMGQLFEWSATLMSFNSDKEKALNEAKKLYQLSTEHRPTWPHTWANYAYIKMRLGENDNNLHTAIDKTIQYGPWIKEAQKKMIIVSLKEWDNLPLPLQLSVNKSILQWLKYKKQDMGRFIISKAVQMGKGYVIRAVLEKNKVKNINTYMKLLKKLATNKSSYCKNSLCSDYPIKRFDERFEV